MKQKLNLRNAILWTVALMALVLFFASFGATAKLKGTIPGESYYIDMTCANAIWGCRSIWGYVEGHYSGSYLNKAVVNVPGLIGAIVLFLAAGGIVAVTFLIKDEKMNKILTFVCGGVILVSGVLFFFVNEAPWYALKESMVEEGIAVDIKSLKNAYSGLKASSAYGIGGGIFAILLAGGVIASQIIPNKQFIKSSGESSEAKEEPKEE